MRRFAFGASAEKRNGKIEQLDLALEVLEAAATVTALVSPMPNAERPMPVQALPAHLPREEGIREPVSGVRRRRTRRRHLHRHRAPCLHRGSLCNMNRVRPQAYSADVIAKIANDWPAARWDELMRWNWQAQSEPARMAA